MEKFINNRKKITNIENIPWNTTINKALENQGWKSRFGRLILDRTIGSSGNFQSRTESEKEIERARRKNNTELEREEEREGKFVYKKPHVVVKIGANRNILGKRKRKKSRGSVINWPHFCIEFCLFLPSISHTISQFLILSLMIFLYVVLSFLIVYMNIMDDIGIQ